MAVQVHVSSKYCFQKCGVRSDINSFKFFHDEVGDCYGYGTEYVPLKIR